MALAVQRRQLTVSAVNGGDEASTLRGARVVGAAQHAAARGWQPRQTRGDIVALRADLCTLLVDRVELAELAQRQSGALSRQLSERGLDRLQGGPLGSNR